MAEDHPWFAGLPRLIQRGKDLHDIIAIRHINGLKAEGGELCCDVPNIHYVLVPTIDLKAVVIHQDRQIIQPVVGGSLGGLPHQAFRQLSATAERIDPDALAVQFGAQRHAHGGGDALPQRAGGGIHAGALLSIRVALQEAVQLAQLLQLCGIKVPPFRKDRVECGSCMTLGEDEAVPRFPMGLAGVHLHLLKVESYQDLHRRQRPARMAGLGRRDRGDDVPAHRLADLLQFVYFQE